MFIKDQRIIKVNYPTLYFRPLTHVQQKLGFFPETKLGKNQNRTHTHTLDTYKLPKFLSFIETIVSIFHQIFVWIDFLPKIVLAAAEFKLW